MSKYVQIAKRENNNKRGFLIVNPYLGKHIAKNPTKVLGMFDEMAKLFPKNWNPKRTLVIGFAETATALGLRYACQNGCLFVQTTREQVPGEHTYLYFSEEHSHATVQYILKDSLDGYVDSIDHIMFVDDEITTGKTVLNAIAAIDKACDKRFDYAVTSVLNSMNKEQRKVYDDCHISMHCMSCLSNEHYSKKADSYNMDGKHFYVPSEYWSDVIPRHYAGLLDTRYVMDTGCYQKRLNRILDVLVEQYNAEVAGKKVLVLGTEEFMYPGLLFASRLYDNVDRAKFHATTRSPIAVSKDNTYPVHRRCEMNSVNEVGRETYLYDVKTYDKVFVMVEAKYATQQGINELVEMLKKCGNTDIHVISL